MADKIKLEVPYFQSPNDIFDLDIEVVAKQRYKDSKATLKIKRPMKAHEKLVYIYFCRCGNNGSNAFPSYNTIAQKCGISRRCAIETVEVLQENNLIAKNFRKRTSSAFQDSNEYIVLSPSEAQKISEFNALPSEQPALPSAQDAPPLVHEVHHPSAHGAPKKELIKKNYIKKNKLRRETYFDDIKNKYFEVFKVLINTSDVSLIQSYIQDGLEVGAILHSLDISAKNKAKNFKYTKAILDNWMDKGLKTIDAINSEETKQGPKDRVKTTIDALWALDLKGDMVNA